MAQDVAYVSLMNRGVYLRQIIASLLAGNEFYKKSTTASLGEISFFLQELPMTTSLRNVNLVGRSSASTTRTHIRVSTEG